jgi:hypothetical protein
VGLYGSSNGAQGQNRYQEGFSYGTASSRAFVSSTLTIFISVARLNRLAAATVAWTPGSSSVRYWPSRSSSTASNSLS